MTRTDRTIIFLSATLLGAIAAFILFVPKAKGQPAPAPIAVPCPPDAKSCKVIVVTPEQEQLMVQMIENTAVQGPYSQIGQAVKFLVDLIGKAPAGTPAKP